MAELYEFFVNLGTNLHKLNPETILQVEYNFKD